MLYLKKNCEGTEFFLMQMSDNSHRELLLHFYKCDVLNFYVKLPPNWLESLRFKGIEKISVKF